MLTERQLNGSGELPERWSAKRKTEIVLRLLRGEDLGQISREIQVAPQVIEEWRRAFLAGAEAGLKKRGGDPLESELVRTRAKLGETLTGAPSLSRAIESPRGESFGVRAGRASIACPLRACMRPAPLPGVEGPNRPQGVAPGHLKPGAPIQ